MITGDFSGCKTLEEFYREITALHLKAHGPHYCDVHNAIRESLKDGQLRYTELGINQGATLACANLTVPLRSSKAYDINIDRFEPQRHLFDHIEYPFIAKKGSSIDSSIADYTDVLYIDTLHQWNHLQKELNLWHPYVSQTIICHDTHAKNDMYRGIVEWVKNKPWKIKEHNTNSVGYTVLQLNES